MAIYWPEADIMQFTRMEPYYSPERDDARGGSAIGVLREHTARQDHARFRVRLNWGQPTLSVLDTVPA